MVDIWMDVDVSLSEVPVNIAALIDDTDFVSREESVAYNAAGMDLVWNFVTTAGATTQTAVTPTTSGVYDWSIQGNGMYTIEIPASGGGSINNDTEGHGWFSGYATGILPWRGPIIGFRAAALNDALIDGGDNLDVNVTLIEGADATTQIGDAVLDEIVESSGSTPGVDQLSLRHVTRIFLSALSGATTGDGTPAYFRDLANAKARITVTLGAGGIRTSISYDGT